MASDSSKLITALLDLPIPSAINLARNGKTLVYTISTGPFGKQKTGEHEVASIWHAESGHANSSRQLTSGLFNDQQPTLSPDGKTVAFTSDRAKQSKSSAIYALSLSGGEPYALTPADNEQSIDQLKWSPDGRFIAYLSPDEKSDAKKEKDKTKDDPLVYGQDWEYNRLRVLHVDSREIKTIVSIDRHFISFDWSNDGDSIAFSSVPTPDVDSNYLGGSIIYIVTPRGNDLKEVANVANEARSLAYTTDAIYFTADVSPVSAISARAVYKLDIRDEGAKHVRVAHGEEDCALDLKRVDNDITCYVQNGMEDHIGFVNGRALIKLPNAIGSWDAAYPKDSDEVIIALVKSDINTPNEVYTTTASGGALVKLSNHGAPLADREVATATFVSCQSTDGDARLEGVFFTPAKHKGEQGTPSKPLATIVSVHGGPYARVTDTFNPTYYYFTNVFLDAGYAVMHPNYRGSSGRGESFANKARGGMGIYDEPDVIALTQHCIEKGFTNKDQVIVAGWSQGGFLSYLCSVRNGMHKYGWKFKGAIPGAGVTDWDAMSFGSDMGFLEADLGGVAAWTTEAKDTSSRNGSAIWEFNKAAKANAIPPMLILHGSEDERVPVSQARAFRRALQFHKLPFEYVEYPREGHLIKERKHLEDMLKRARRFADQCLTKN